MTDIRVSIDCDPNEVHCGDCFMKNKPYFGHCLKFGYLEIDKIPVKIGDNIDGILHECKRCQQCLDAEIK